MRELTSQDFDEVVGAGRVVVDFWAPWCAPCRFFAPTFEEVSKEIPDVSFVKLNTEDAPDIAGKVGIRAIPTLVFFRDGKEAGRVAGAMPKAQFKQKINELLG
jgi:thioredoxin 1